MSVKLQVDWLIQGGLFTNYKFFILGCMTTNLYLTFHTLYSSSVWRTDTIASSKLNEPSPLK